MITGIELLKAVPGLWNLIEKVKGQFKQKEEDKWVDHTYPEKIGLEKKLDTEGYKTLWSNESKVAIRVEREGYEIVKVKEGKILYTIRKRDNPENQILLKKKK